MILRREATQLTGIIERFTELLGGRNGYNGSERIWRLAGRQIEFGSTPNRDDWNKYQRRPHDFLVFDEATNFLETQVRALLGWLRSVDPKQRCQALLTFKPPTTSEGRWIVSFFAPWLDRRHPHPAQPGEPRWFAMIDGTETETPDGPTVAGLSIAALRDRAAIHIDVVGIGASPYDFLKSAGVQVIGVNVAEAATRMDKPGRLTFRNLRSQLWWMMREALDPVNNTGIALPPSRELAADLCAPTWELAGSTIQVAGRDEIIQRIGRSPDYASAYVLALLDTPKRGGLATRAGKISREYGPYGLHKS